METPSRARESVEGEKERIQVFEGAVIARKGLLNTETFTVRKVSYGVGVGTNFPAPFADRHAR